LLENKGVKNPEMLFTLEARFGAVNVATMPQVYRAASGQFSAAPRQPKGVVLRIE